MRYWEILELKNLKECTSSSSIATSVSPVTSKGALGVGMDPDGDWGIYNDMKPKKKKKKHKTSKPLVLKRK